MSATNDLTEGLEFGGPYPFVREKVVLWCEGGNSEVETWKPGARFEDVYRSPEDVDSECVADGIGEIILTVVSVHKPGRFPTRVFYTRRWRSPAGREFGKTACRCATVEKFRRLAKGYAFAFVVKDAAEKAA